MSKYDIIYEVLQEQVETGDLSLETAEYLNDIAYDMYSTEYADVEEVVNIQNPAEAAIRRHQAEQIRAAKKRIVDRQQAVANANREQNKIGMLGSLTSEQREQIKKELQQKGARAVEEDFAKDFERIFKRKFGTGHRIA